MEQEIQQNHNDSYLMNKKQLGIHISMDLNFLQ
jgi:hypothetical protein